MIMQQGCLNLWQTEIVMNILPLKCVEWNDSKHLFDPILKTAVYLTSFLNRLHKKVSAVEDWMLPEYF